MEWIPAAISSAGSSSKTTNKSKEKKGVNKKVSKGVKLSTDPQSVAARERRHRISDRFKILQSMVPGGSKMDTVSMLEEAIHYVKFLKAQIWLHQTMINFVDDEYSHSQMFLPSDQCYYCCPNEHNIDSLQQNPSVSVESVQNLPQPPPLEQFCFQGEGDTIFNATMKYWPA